MPHLLRRAALSVLLASCGLPGPHRRCPEPAIAIAALRQGLDPFLAAHPLAPGAEIRADEVARTAAASVHVVQVRGRERPHRHATHDLVVHVLRGRGTLTLGDERLAMTAGDVAVVPRDVPHWFAAEPGAPAIALVTFAPPLTAPDHVPVADVDSMGGRR